MAAMDFVTVNPAHIERFPEFAAAASAGLQTPRSPKWYQQQSGFGIHQSPDIIIGGPTNEVQPQWTMS